MFMPMPLIGPAETNSTDNQCPPEPTTRPDTQEKSDFTSGGKENNGGDCSKVALSLLMGRVFEFISLTFNLNQSGQQLR